MADGDGGQIDRIFDNIETLNTNMNQMNIDINQRISDTREEILVGQKGMKTMLQIHIDSDKDTVTSRRFRITTGIQWIGLGILAIALIVTIIVAV